MGKRKAREAEKLVSYQRGTRAGRPSGNASITFKVPMGDGGCTEAHFQKPRVYFPEVHRP